MPAETVLDLTPADRLLTDRDLPYDDGEPMDTPWHRTAMNVLIDSFEAHRAAQGRKDFYCGGDMFLYFSKERVFNKDFRGPDFFVVNGVDRDRPRLSWVVWQEGDRFPDVIVELTSPSTAAIDRGPKLALYRDVFRTSEYYIYDPETDTFDGYQRRNGHVDPLDIEPSGRVWSRALELYIGTADGVYNYTPGRYVRFFDVRGNLIPTRQESEAARADAAAERAAAETARAAAAAERAKAAVDRAAAAEAELARLRDELAALRQPPPSP